MGIQHMISNRSGSSSNSALGFGSLRRGPFAKFAGLAGMGAALALVACSSSDAVTGAGGAGTGGSGAGATGDAGSGGTPNGGGGSGGAGAGAGGVAGSVGGIGGSAGNAGAGGANGGASGTAGANNAGAGGGSPQCNTAAGKALQFDNSVVDLMSGDLGADFPGGDVPRTIELWAKFLGKQSWKAEGSILETGLAAGGGNKVLGLDLSGYDGTTAEFGPYTNGFSDNNHPNGVYVPNTPESGWLHLAWAYTGNHGTFSFTVNGKEYPVITQGGKPTLDFTPGIVTLGASQTFGTQGWSGVMDEVRLWSVAKTPAEIAANMNVVLTGTEPGLVAYYRFDEGSGDFTDDTSKKPSHRLQSCTSKSTRCAEVNAAKPVWVDSDLPGPFSCAR